MLTPTLWTVTNSNNCSASDSFVLSVDETPVFSFPETIDRCEGETATLTVSVPFENIIWSTGATGNEITVGASDIYWAEATPCM